MRPERTVEIRRGRKEKSKMARVYARLIHRGDGKWSLKKVPIRWRAAAKAAYFELYGILLEDET